MVGLGVNMAKSTFCDQCGRDIEKECPRDHDTLPIRAIQAENISGSYDNGPVDREWDFCSWVGCVYTSFQRKGIRWLYNGSSVSMRHVRKGYCWSSDQQHFFRWG